MKRFILVILALVIALVIVSGAVFGLFIWRFTPQIPQASYPEPATATEARLQDLDYLRRLPEADRSFSESEMAALNAHIDELEGRADTLSEARFLMEVAAAAAITENGHTNVSTRSTMDRLNSLPVRFAWFADGLHIVRAHAEHADLIGTRVAAYEGQDPETLYPQLDPYFGGNDAFLRQNTAYHFAAPASLHAIGLIDRPDTVSLELVDTDGTVFSQTLSVESEPTRFFPVYRYSLAQTHEYEAQSAHDWRFLDSATTEATWYGRHPPQALWADTLDHGGAYWRMRNVYGDPETPLSAWLQDQASSLRENPARYLVLDLRANSGGDYTLAMPVMSKIDELVQPGGRIYVLTDGDTFSAGIVTAFYALHSGGENAIHAGAAMGDDAQFWAEGGGNGMRLPNSDVGIFVSTGYHDWENGCTDWSRCFWVNILFGVEVGSVEIDLDAPLLFSDYRRGIDSGVEAILAAEAARAR
ncbi:hypothetical protein [Marinicauda sp. Alg238-R41]|uniref:hypothetical protein n=1 Tax=Marinicauda sp. Alg238-R41 TaxID=2993447 RepID=UPI0022DF29DC|nr:hypothetical protein [Marinicauda sp. Alg238-R41]